MIAQRRLTDGDIDKLAGHLQGSCESLESALEALFDLSESCLTINDCLALDALVFCCTACDWWFEMSEMSENCGDVWKCEECDQ